MPLKTTSFYGRSLPRPFISVREDERAVPNFSVLGPLLGAHPASKPASITWPFPPKVAPKTGVLL
jgi:hypothetical protein